MDEESSAVKAWQEEVRSNMFTRFFIEINSVAKDPRSMVLVSHGMVEMMINIIVKMKCKNGRKISSNSRDYPHSIKLIILNEIGLLSNHDYGILDKFRRLRNKAAHEPIFGESEIYSAMGIPAGAFESLPFYFMQMPQNLLTMHWDVLGPELLPAAYSAPDELL